MDFTGGHSGMTLFRGSSAVENTNPAIVLQTDLLDTHQLCQEDDECKHVSRAGQEV